MLKSVHFKKTVAWFSFFSKLCFDLYWKYHNFERNKNCATGIFKWTNFNGFFVNTPNKLQVQDSQKPWIWHWLWAPLFEFWGNSLPRTFGHTRSLPYFSKQTHRIIETFGHYFNLSFQYHHHPVNSKILVIPRFSFFNIGGFRGQVISEGHFDFIVLP